MNSIPVLVEAKKEYTNQLQQILTPRLYEGFKSIYGDILKALSDEMVNGNNQSGSVIKLFQKSLKDIPLWNNEMIKNEYIRIERTSNCDYFENLIEAIFITNTKILTSVQINNSESLNIKINVPQSQHFIHKCYIECSKEIYKNPYIFDISKGLTPKEKHSNLRDGISIINHSISNAIRDLLPIRDILKQGLINKINNNFNQEETNEEKNKEETNEEEINEEETNEEETNEEETNEEERKEERKEETLVKEIHLNENTNNGLDIENKNEEQDMDDEINNEEQYKEYEDNEEDNDEDNEEDYDNIIENNENEISFNGKVENEETKVIDLNTKISNETDNNNSQLKQITLGTNPIIKKIDNIQKVEKFENKEENSNSKIEDLLKPNLTLEKTQSIPKLNNIIPTITKTHTKSLIKNKYIGGNKMNNSFYHKKYDENLANYKYTSESYLDEDDNSISKNKLNIDYNSSDDEDNNPIELV
jgi:hypothetical protein